MRQLRWRSGRGMAAVALGALLTAVPALGDPATEPGVYAGVGLGYGAQAINQAPLILGPGQSLSRDIEGSDLALHPFIGVRLHRYAAVEIGYIDLGSVDDLNPGLSPGGQVLQVADGVSTDGWEAMLVGMWPINRDFEAFGKVGLVSWDSDRALDGVATGTVDGEDLAYGIGIDYIGTGRLRFRVEGTRYDLQGFDESIAVTGSVFYALPFAR